MRLTAIRTVAARLRPSAAVSFAIVCAFSLFGFGQTSQQKKVEPAAVKTQANPASGEELYKAYCASCHGVDAKGGGPAAEALRMRPADLTQLAARNGKKFPAFRVEQMLGGSDELRAHGSRQMPVWGPIFRQLSRDEGLAALRVRNLVGYLAKIQAK